MEQAPACCSPLKEQPSGTHENEDSFFSEFIFNQLQMGSRCVDKAKKPLHLGLSFSKKLNHRYTTSAAGERSPNERLRILFCGSERFSSYSLEALAEYARSGDSNIESIDVVTRKDKLSGRGLKKLKPTAIKTLARKLQLPLHQIDTFTGWDPPVHRKSAGSKSSIDLIIAVSFGLLVPPRILRGATYGGLNVHPSLLPRFKGASPIQWSILHGLQETGVTLQTLHQTKFDEGTILSQISTAINQPSTCTSGDLIDQLGPIGASLLINGLREKQYASKSTPSAVSGHKAISYAPRFGTRHLSVDASMHSADQISRMERAFGKVWAYAETLDSTIIRVSFNGIQAINQQPFGSRHTANTMPMRPVGVPYAVLGKGELPQHSDGKSLFMNTVNGCVAIRELIASGSSRDDAVKAAMKAKLLQYHKSHTDPGGVAWDIYTFCAPIRGEVDCLPTIAP